MTHPAALLGALAAIYLAACISPGPNWLMISSLAVRGERRSAMAVACGIALGSTTWATLAIIGAATVLRSPALASVLRLCGAAYLAWYGWTLIRRPTVAGSTPVPEAATAHLRTGLLASLSNPKAGMFWTSVFAANVPAQTPLWMWAAIVALVAVMSSAFHLGIAAVFDSRTLQSAYLRAGHALQRAAGMFLVLAAVKLAAAG